MASRLGPDDAKFRKDPNRRNWLQLPDAKTLAAILAPYRTPTFHNALVQLGTSVLGFAASWGAALWALSVSYWLTLACAVIAAGFVLRLFMIQHDCGHGAFFPSHRLNDLVGAVIGIFTLVPYTYWRKTHAIHHKTSGDLDYRTFGDIKTLTVREYQALSWRRRLLYRFYRHPLILLGLGPVYQFVLKHRLPLDIPRSWGREWFSVFYTNLGILAMLAIAWNTIGLERFLLVQAPITIISGSFGVFLFYVQHQFEDTYWREHPDWDFHAAGLQGSSYLVLPRILQWFTANIGLHHIHHVNSRVPNYRLPKVYAEQPIFRHVTRITLWDGVKTLRLALWDEVSQKLISFRRARRVTA
jgi:omega-6 fatty acid desaturase (delta-12 desaturase)